MAKIKYISILFLLVSHFIYAADGIEIDQKYIDTVKYELRQFISKVKSGSIKNGLYDVYILKMSSDEKSVCVSFHNIFNEFQIDKVKGQRYAIIDGEYVVLNIEDRFQPYYEQTFETKILDSNARNLIQGKLVPQKRGGITGRPPGMLVCKYADTIEAKFFKDADIMPQKMQLMSHLRVL